jgi:hypothetical protein
LGYTPREFMLSLMGKKGEPSSGGRQMPNHWSLKRANVISHSAPVATQTSHAAGIGLAIKLRGEDKVVLTTVGEGSTSQGEWYEGVNWAAVHKLPVFLSSSIISMPSQYGKKNKWRCPTQPTKRSVWDCRASQWMEWISLLCIR